MGAMSTVAPYRELQADVIQMLVDHALKTSYEDLPESTREATKRLMLDTLGAAVAGTVAEGCPELEELVAGWSGRPEARVIGSGRRVLAQHAALVNSTMGRALELDDVHEEALLHSTVTHVPIALAVAERIGGVSGEDLLTAVALGIDIGARLSLAPKISVMGEGYSYRGMSYTYQTGMLAGALVAGKLMGFDRDQLLNAVGIAYSQCAGNQQCLIEGASTVRLQQGLSSQAAVLAALFTEVGLTGTRNSLEGKYGWFNAFYQGNYDRSVIVDGLGERFETDRVSIKPFPCCKYTHTALSAVLKARAQATFRPEDVERVVLHVNNFEYMNVVCLPLEEKRSPEQLTGPRGWVQGQFSLPFLAAAAIVRGRVTLAELSLDSRSDRTILDLTQRVEPVMDPEVKGQGRILPTPGDAEIFLRDGRVLREVVRYAKGHFNNPMSYDEVADKFRECARFSGKPMPRAQVEAAIEAVRGIEKMDDAAGIMDLLTW